MADVIMDTELGEINDKGFIADEVRNAIFRRLRQATANRLCLDCNTRNPTWISLSHGTYVCLECSGEHRRKGVHISFVRSVDMDSFTPEQIIMMAVGGNAKAREYFKNHGMGKEVTGKPPDYHSKAALRYRQTIEKEAQALCVKKGVTFKATASGVETKDTKDEVPAQPAQLSATKSAPLPGAAAKVAPKAGGYAGNAVPKAKASSFFDDFDSASTTKAPEPKVAPAKSAGYQSAPMGPQSVVIKRAPPPPPANKVSSVVGIQTNSVVAGSSSMPVTAAKPKGKEIDFDFDFDDLEQEAAKPPPKAPEPPPKVERAVTEPVRSAPAPAQQSSMDKYNNSKAISSDDFFGAGEESAAARMEREMRYNKFANQGAISSDAFFDDGEQGQRNNGVSKSEMLAIGVDKSKQFFSSFLNKGQN